jgi:hypothetical protein
MIGNTVRTEGAIALTVREVLAMAGIRLWSESAIHSYMNAERAKYRPNIWHYVGKPIECAGALLVSVGLLALFAGCAGLCIGGLHDLINWTTSTSPARSESFSLIGYSAACAGLGFALVVIVSSFMNWLTGLNLVAVGPARWARHLARYYPGAVPAEAERVKNRIRAYFPNAEFLIDELVQDKRSLDPVLWVRVPGEADLPVLVWDEHGNIVLPR